jgi:hypothetical protein
MKDDVTQVRRRETYVTRGQRLCNLRSVKSSHKPSNMGSLHGNSLQRRRHLTLLPTDMPEKTMNDTVHEREHM